MHLMWPKPKDMPKKKPEAVRKFAGDREVCNLLTKAGRDIYMDRIRQMWERQGRRCYLESLVAECPGRLSIREATFDHDEGRGMGGGCQDDRIEVPDGRGGMVPVNGAAHALCNSLKGSVRLSRLLEYGDVL